MRRIHNINDGVYNTPHNPYGVRRVYPDDDPVVVSHEVYADGHVGTTQGSEIDRGWFVPGFEFVW